MTTGASSTTPTRCFSEPAYTKSTTSQPSWSACALLPDPEPTREAPGIQLLLPVLFGFYDYDYDGVVEARVPGDAATLSFVPAGIRVSGNGSLAIATIRPGGHGS